MWIWEGDAFGILPPDGDPDKDGKKTVINLRGAGLYADSETSLTNNGDRYYSSSLGRFITADRRSVAEHVQRWQPNLGQPGQPPLEINAFARVANNPLRWIDPDGLEAGSPNAYDPNFPDPTVPEVGLDSLCVECVIVPAARAGKIAKACIDIAKKDIVQKACKNAVLAAALGSAICEGKPPGQFPRDRQRIENVRNAADQTLRKNTGSVRDK